MARPREEGQQYTRLLKCTLVIEESRAYWRHVGLGGSAVTARRAFDEYWFGARSLDRIEVLLGSLRARYDAYPAALRVLSQWTGMDPETRRLICHWHLQLSDPLYRRFTGDYLVDRHHRPEPTVSHDLALGWVSRQDPGRWNMATRAQFASKLLSSAHAAQLVTSTQDPRPLSYPRVPDLALSYLLYLLRGVHFAGTLLDNPYTRSVGLAGRAFEARLRSLPGIAFGRQGDLVDFGWSHPDLESWAAVYTVSEEPLAAGGLR
jgi:hypothetical protein